MRKVTFEVPTEVMAEFSEKLIELDFDNSIVGVNEHNEIEIEVQHDRTQTEQIDELEEYLDDLVKSIDEEEEDEEEDN